MLCSPVQLHLQHLGTILRPLKSMIKSSIVFIRKQEQAPIQGGEFWGLKLVSYRKLLGGNKPHTVLDPVAFCS